LEDNIKTNLKKIAWVVVDWIDLAQEGGDWFFWFHERQGIP
jgi:hypothetical protein